MPIIQRKCPNGHVTDQYLHTWHSFPVIKDCGECGEWAWVPMASFGKPLTWFRESRQQVIMNLDAKTPITSHEHHKRVMKERGLEPLTDWHTSKRRSAM